MIPLLTPFRLPANAPLSAGGVSHFGSKAAPAYVAATSSAFFAALISRAVLRALRRNGSSVSFDRVIIAPKISRWNEMRCRSYRSVGSKFVSVESLFKTGVSAVLGDFREILAEVAIFWSPETTRKYPKSPQNAGFSRTRAHYL
jgi:hypothetical protein